jgi:hypothetical protein
VGAMVKSFVLESYVFEGTQCGFTSEQQHLAKTKFIQWNQMIETCFGQIHNMVKRTDASITFQHVRLHDTVRHQAAEIQVELSPWLATQPS